MCGIVAVPVRMRHPCPNCPRKKVEDHAPRGRARSMEGALIREAEVRRPDQHWPLPERWQSALKAGALIRLGRLA